MRKKLTMDISFDFEGIVLGNGNNGICNVCGRRYRHHGIPVPFSGWRGAKYGPVFAQDGVHYGEGFLCADCILSSPVELAGKIRTRAGAVLRKPNTRRKQRVEAEGMIELAGELEKVGSLKDLPGGIMAVKIGEAYREIEGHPRRTRKAA
jgi:hypothetical protein